MCIRDRCRNTSPKELSPDYVKLEQIEPPSEEYIVEVQQQIQRPTHTSPLPDEFLTQVRSQIYLTTQDHFFPSTPVLCIDQASKEDPKREDQCQKFINQDLGFLPNKIPNTKPNRISLPQKNHQDQSQPIQSVEPALGFTLQEYQEVKEDPDIDVCLLYTSPSPRDATLSRMPSSA